MRVMPRLAFLRPIPELRFAHESFQFPSVSARTLVLGLARGTSFDIRTHLAYATSAASARLLPKLRFAEVAQRKFSVFAANVSYVPAIATSAAKREFDSR